MHIQLPAFKGGEHERTLTPLDAHAFEKPRRTDLLPPKRKEFAPPHGTRVPPSHHRDGPYCHHGSAEIYPFY
jgi:hypothetical protein